MEADPAPRDEAGGGCLRGGRAPGGPSPRCPAAALVASAGAGGLRRRATFLSVFLCLIATNASAQRQFVLGSARFEVVPESQFDSSTNVALASTRLTVVSLVPVPLADRTVLAVAPRYRLWRFTSREIEDRTLHDLGVAVSLGHRVSTAWSLRGGLGLGIASDFEDVETSHFRVTGAVSALYTFGPRLRLGLGAAASYGFGELLPLPILVATWTPTEAIEVLATLPQRAALNYSFNRRLSAGLKFTLEGSQFSVGRSQVESVAASIGTVEARAAGRIFGGIWAVLSGGTTVLRRFELLGARGQSLVDPNPERALIAGLALEWRVTAPRRQRGR